MTTRRSARAKGRRGQKEVVDLILTTFPELTGEDVMSQPSSIPGEDIILTRKARTILPYSIEVKYQETLSIWASLKQAMSRKWPGLLFFKKNNTEWYVAMKASTALDLM